MYSLGIEIPRAPSTKMRPMTNKSVKGKTLSDFPEILALWDVEKNGLTIPLRNRTAPPRDVLAADVPAGCTKKVHWKCPHGPDHQWYYWIGHMTRGGENATFKTNKCPFCSNSRASVTNSVGSLYPDAAKEWHPTKNGVLTPQDVVASSTARRWWICENGHETSKSPYHRCIRELSCKKCKGRISGRKVSEFPEYAALWSLERNEVSPEECSAGRNQKYWWKCPEGDDHYWFAAPVDVIGQNQGCAICSGKQVVPSTSLAVCSPELAKHWHSTKNGNLTPYHVTNNSSKHDIWWKCEKGHEWRSTVYKRTREGGKKDCPDCHLEKTCIANTAPELLATWDWDENDLTPDQVSNASNQDIAWKCNDCDYKWVTKPAWRRVTTTPGNWRFTGCPSCSKFGFDTESMSWIYLISVLNSDKDILFYKLGITNRDPVFERIPEIIKSMRKIPRYSECVVSINEILPYENGKDAKQLEHNLKQIEELRFNPSEKFFGSSELFISNPLEYARVRGWIC